MPDRRTGVRILTTTAVASSVALILLVIIQVIRPGLAELLGIALIFGALIAVVHALTAVLRAELQTQQLLSTHDLQTRQLMSIHDRQIGNRLGHVEGQTHNILVAAGLAEPSDESSDELADRRRIRGL